MPRDVKQTRHDGAPSTETRASGATVISEMKRSRQPFLVSLFHRFSFSYVLLLFVVLGNAVPPLGAEEGSLLDMRVRGETAISFMLDEGAIVPEQVLFDLEVLDLKEKEIKPEIILTVLRGEASFALGAREVYAPVQKGGVVMPALLAGPIGDKSYVRVAIKGERLFPDLRFVTLGTGRLKELKHMIAELGGIGRGATLVIGEHYVVVDMSRLDYSKIELYGGSEGESRPVPIPRSTPQGAAPREGFGRFNEPDYDCNAGCYRSFAGPGLVKWVSSDPWGIYHYSVKPEVGGNVLLIAQAPEQDIDGVYNQAWGNNGCGLALKVPDSCTATVGHPNSLVHCCCNSIMRLFFGIECESINTYTLSDWRDCAL